MSCDVQGAPQFIRYAVTGEWPTIDEHRALRQALIEQGHLTRETRALFDIRMSATTPDYGEVRTMISAAMTQGGLPLRRAYLVGTAVQVGLVRQMQSLAPPSIAVEVFTTEAEAIAWLSRI